eukprot:Gb_21159 [translate_table: standard]
MESKLEVASASDEMPKDERSVEESTSLGTQSVVDSSSSEKFDEKDLKGLGNSENLDEELDSKEMENSKKFDGLISSAKLNDFANPREFDEESELKKFDEEKDLKELKKSKNFEEAPVAKEDEQSDVLETLEDSGNHQNMPAENAKNGLQFEASMLHNKQGVQNEQEELCESEKIKGKWQVEEVGLINITEEEESLQHEESIMGAQVQDPKHQPKEPRTEDLAEAGIPCSRPEPESLIIPGNSVDFDAEYEEANANQNQVNTEKNLPSLGNGEGLQVQSREDDTEQISGSTDTNLNSENVFILRDVDKYEDQCAEEEKFIHNIADEILDFVTSTDLGEPLVEEPHAGDANDTAAVIEQYSESEAIERHGWLVEEQGDDTKEVAGSFHWEGVPRENDSLTGNWLNKHQNGLLESGKEESYGIQTNSNFVSAMQEDRDPHEEENRTFSSQEITEAPVWQSTTVFVAESSKDQNGLAQEEGEHTFSGQEIHEVCPQNEENAHHLIDSQELYPCEQLTPEQSMVEQQPSLSVQASEQEENLVEGAKLESCNEDEQPVAQSMSKEENGHHIIDSQELNTYERLTPEQSTVEQQPSLSLQASVQGENLAKGAKLESCTEDEQLVAQSMSLLSVTRKADVVTHITTMEEVIDRCEQDVKSVELSSVIDKMESPRKGTDIEAYSAKEEQGETIDLSFAIDGMNGCPSEDIKVEACGDKQQKFKTVEMPSVDEEMASTLIEDQSGETVFEDCEKLKQCSSLDEIMVQNDRTDVLNGGDESSAIEVQAHVNEGGFQIEEPISPNITAGDQRDMNDNTIEIVASENQLQTTEVLRMTENLTENTLSSDQPSEDIKQLQAKEVLEKTTMDLHPEQFTTPATESGETPSVVPRCGPLEDPNGRVRDEDGKPSVAPNKEVGKDCTSMCDYLTSECQQCTLFKECCGLWDWLLGHRD